MYNLYAKFLQVLLEPQIDMLMDLRLYLVHYLLLRGNITIQGYLNQNLQLQ